MRREAEQAEREATDEADSEDPDAGGARPA